MNLYSKLSKLAVDVPSIRKHLVPLLRKHAHLNVESAEDPGLGYVEGNDDKSAGWSGRSRGQGGDPRWINARRPGVDEKGIPFRAGDRVLYYPQTKSILTGKAAEQAWREFEGARADEDFMGRWAAARIAREKWDKILVGDKTRIRISGHPRHYVVIEELPQKGKRSLKRFTFGIGGQIQSLNGTGPLGKIYDYFMIENLERDWKPNASQTAEASAAGLKKAIEKAFKDLDKEGLEYPDWVSQSLTGRWMPKEEDVNYLQVEPVDYAPVEIKAKDEFYIKAEWTSFDVTLNNGYTDKQLDEYAFGGDPHYTKLVSTSPAGARKMFLWAKANQDDIKRMTGKQLQAKMDQGGIKYKYQFSVWS